MNATQTIADAIRDVTASVQKQIDEGFRGRVIDAADVVEILLAIADRVDPSFATPQLGNPLVHAARALLEARENQMVTHVEWDALKAAVEAAS